MNVRGELFTVDDEMGLKGFRFVILAGLEPLDEECVLKMVDVKGGALCRWVGR